MPTVAIITRHTDAGEVKVYAIEFYEGLASFMDWVNSIPDQIKKVTANEGITKFGEVEVYDGDTQANVFAYLPGERSKLYAWKMSDMNWAYAESQAFNQEREPTRGRPASPVMPLQTWKKWAKKEGAYI